MFRIFLGCFYYFKICLYITIFWNGNKILVFLTKIDFFFLQWLNYFVHNSKSKGDIKKIYRDDPPLFMLINTNKQLIEKKLFIFGENVTFVIFYIFASFTVPTKMICALPHGFFSLFWLETWNWTKLIIDCHYGLLASWDMEP